MNIYNRVSYKGYVDESNWNESVRDFRSLACVSFQEKNYDYISQKIDEVWPRVGTKSKVVKWANVSSRTNERQVKQIIKVVSDLAYEKNLRVDTLIWSKSDCRHNVQERIGEQLLDKKDLHNMCGICLRNVIHRRWQKNTPLFGGTVVSWSFLIDQNPGIDNSRLERSLPFYKDKNDENLVVNVHQGTAQSNRFIQIADIFAGMGAYSHEFCSKFHARQNRNSGQLNFLELVENPVVKSPPNSKQRFAVIEYLLDLCIDCGFGVSIDGKTGLIVKDPKTPINFWLYKATHPKDIAPSAKKNAKLKIIPVVG